MKCGSCDFSVPQNLKFAIMKNFCPQCGEKLFSDSEMNDISLMQSRVNSQDFSDSLTEDLVFDITLFVYNEIKNGYGRVLLTKEIEKEMSAEQTEEGSVESQEEILKKIRNEEAQRVKLEQEAGAPRTAPTDETHDERVHRLKEIASKNTFKNKPITRLS